MTARRISVLALATMLLAGTSFSVAACGDSSDTTTTTAVSTGVTDTAESDTLDEASSTEATPAETGSIEISGLVDYPLTLTAEDLDYMYWATVTADHPQLGSGEFEGVLFSDIFTYVGVQTDATAMVLTGADGSTASIPLADLDTTTALLAVSEDGSMNAILPGLADTDWIQNIVQIDFE